MTLGNQKKFGPKKRLSFRARRAGRGGVDGSKVKIDEFDIADPDPFVRKTAKNMAERLRVKAAREKRTKDVQATLPEHLSIGLDVARERGGGKLRAAEKIGKARRKGGMFQTLGMVAGAIGGFYFGGPAGGALGARLGGSVGKAASGTSSQVGTDQGSQQLQQNLSLGGQLASFGFSAPPQTSGPDLGSSQINPFALSEQQSALFGGGGQQQKPLRQDIFGGGGFNG